DLCSVRSRFAAALEAHHSGARPCDRIALSIGDGDHRVVEAGVHGSDAGRDVLAFPPTEALGFACHSKIPVIHSPDRWSKAKLNPWKKLTSSCLRSAWPCPCECAHWCACAGRGPEGPCGGEGHGSTRGPSAA